MQDRSVWTGQGPNDVIHSRWSCERCSKYNVHAVRKQHLSLVKRAASELIASAKITTLATTSQCYSVPGGDREEHAPEQSAASGK